MDCDLVNPLGEKVVRQYDKNLCIVSRKVFIVYYGGHLFGTTEFSDITEFTDYRNDQCCGLSLGPCCVLTFDDDNLIV